MSVIAVSKYDSTRPSWQYELQDSSITVEQLLQRLGVCETELPSYLANGLRAAAKWPLRVPDSFIRRMQPASPTDPLLLQVLPQSRELETVPGFIADPVGEFNSSPQQGLIQKYHGRALLMLTEACAVHCRYCFRREYDYTAHRIDRNQWRQLFQGLAADTSLSELIMSGGDPLIHSNDSLAWFIEQIEQLEHISTLRIHSRVPVVLPSRMDEELIERLASSRLKAVLVIHSNHANELDDSVAKAMQACASKGITLLNQSVMLHNINDNVDTLVTLSTRLFECGVLPYYLHLLDPVSGAAHFDVKQARAVELHQQMAARLPGYLVPKMVRELPGAAAKQAVNG